MRWLFNSNFVFFPKQHTNTNTHKKTMELGLCYSLYTYHSPILHNLNEVEEFHSRTLLPISRKISLDGIDILRILCEDDVLFMDQLLDYFVLNKIWKLKFNRIKFTPKLIDILFKYQEKIKEINLSQCKNIDLFFQKSTWNQTTLKITCDYLPPGILDCFSFCETFVFYSKNYGEIVQKIKEIKKVNLTFTYDYNSEYFIDEHEFKDFLCVIGSKNCLPETLLIPPTLFDKHKLWVNTWKILESEKMYIWVHLFRKYGVSLYILKQMIQNTFID